MVLFINNPTVQKVGEVVLGFGVLFMGLTSMSSAMSVLRDSPLITSYLQTLDNHFLGVLFGFIMTAILQSSSVTVSIVLLMASRDYCIFQSASLLFLDVIWDLVCPHCLPA